MPKTPRLRAWIHAIPWALGLTAACGPAPDDRRAAAQAPSAPLNLVLVSIDTLRADRLGCYGNDGDHTPHIDRLAASAIVFENAVSPMATTFPSHATMFTGRYPRQHGVRWNGGGLASEQTTLAEHLKQAGYATAAFVSYKAMVNRGGLGQGFDVVSDPRPPRRKDSTRDGAEVNESAIAWLRGHLEQRDRGPFFLFVHYFEPHTPYTPTDYSTARLADYDGPFDQGFTDEALRTYEGRLAEAPGDVRAIEVLYEGNVREADERVGELMDRLERHDLRRDTIVVLLSDHGELMGEHDQFGHGPLLWHPLLNVPLLIADPRLAPGRVRHRVGLVDLMPTLLDLLSLPVPEGLAGRSLEPVLYGRRGEDRRYYAEVRLPPPGQETTGRWYESVAVYDGPYKLVLGPEGSQLYDLEVDPAESRDVAGELPEVFAALERFGRSHQGRSSGPREETVDEDVLEELRALGYLE